MKRYYKYINTFFVVTPMTFFMACITSIGRVDLSYDGLLIFLKNWLTMLPTAYILAFVILPIARKITDKIIR